LIEKKGDAYLRITPSTPTSSGGGTMGAKGGRGPPQVL